MTTFKKSRTFGATPKAVYAAFAAPERLARWWGPDGFRNTFEIFDFKPGGLWRFTMHGPDGADYPNESTFISLEPGRAIVLKHLNQPHFQLSIGLEATTGGTLVTWEQAFDSAEVAAKVKHIVEPANEQNLNRWEAEVGAANPLNHSSNQLFRESTHATALLAGKVVSHVVRHRANEVLVEFTDGCRLFVNHSPDGVDVSITGTEHS